MQKLQGVRASGLPWAQFFAGVMRYAAYCVGTPPAYIKHPTTWLNRGCWDDEHGRPRAQQDRRPRGGTSELLFEMMERDHAGTGSDRSDVSPDSEQRVVDAPAITHHRRP
jgi:hypothetical protein